MFFSQGVTRTFFELTISAFVSAALAAGFVAPAGAQQAATAMQLPASAPQLVALPLPQDRGEAKLEQTLKQLGTTASIMTIVAHPDDEDGAMLTYMTRGMGARAMSFTLTRGEGGQNAMSADSYDALGIIRTNELLKASEYYGAKQVWGTEVDYGFSKTQEEAFQKWGHDRVLYDAVLAVRRERPQVIVSTFVGGITDGHGQHQVSGEIAQEVFKAAGDPKVFPDQLKPVSQGGLGLQPWQPLAVYSRTPFAPVTSKGMFDYATGKWSPARFRNYVTGEWSTTVPSTDAQVPVGTLDLTLGQTYAQIAHEGWGEQKSQYGGANPLLRGPATGSYHLWAVAASARASGGTKNDGLFANSKVKIDTSVAGLAGLVKAPAPEWLASELKTIADEIGQVESACPCKSGVSLARQLAPIYGKTLALREKVAGSEFDAEGKAGLLFELDAKIGEFQSALADALGLDMIAFRSNEGHAQGSGFRGASPDESSTSVSPGQQMFVQVHASQATSETKLEKVWLESRTGDAWKSSVGNGAVNSTAPVSDPVFTVQVPENA